MTKDIVSNFYFLLNKLKKHEPFGFGRFSDGEMYIMDNKELILASNHNIIDGKKDQKAAYAPEDHKHFDPAKHGFFRDRLLEAYRFKKPNYFVGLSCRCCVGEENYRKFLEWYEGDPDDPHLTWANLWVNANYRLFKNHFIPELKNHKIVIVCNEKADLSKLPFLVEKDFRVGQNCIINDYGLIEVMKAWIKEHEIKDYVFLFSASSLSNFLVHELFRDCENNTYIDIGTCLNPWLGLTTKRGYLVGGKSLQKKCIW